MAAVLATPLAEPAKPDERERQSLPPKSYAAAVEKDPPASDIFSTRSEAELVPNGTNGSTIHDGQGPKHMASVLRIVDTGASEEDKQSDRPSIERQESQREYSADGLDDSPKKPPRNHRKKKTTSSQDNLRDKASVASVEVQKPKETAKAMKAEKSKKAEKVKDDGKSEDKKKQHFEKVEVERNGSKLVSIKLDEEFEKTRRNDVKEEPKPNKDDQKLVSGRKAGQRWETSAIRFAPLNVPLQRRLQTLVVLFHTLCIALSVSTFFFVCAIPLFWPLIIPYLIYCMVSTAATSGTMTHRSEFFRRSPVWSLFASYFPARLHRTQELPPTRKYIFGYHPHGIISHGAFAAFSTEALGFSQLFPGIKNTLLTLDSNFRIPFYRDYALAMGLASVSKESCENLLSRGGPNKEGMGRAITIVIGGARESLDAQPYSLRLVLQRRKGFVKMAIRTGADLVPVLAFGENDLYDQFSAETHPKIHKFQLLVKKVMGFTIPLFHARGVFNYDVGLMPYRRPLNIVVGRPIKVAQSSKPTQEEIDRIHKEYVTELVRVWDTWKDEFAPHRKSELEILE
ncbi:hypothetical protein BP6252_05192 [Coleophoma cylindrospora]|uniref:diacylglycerol O-acyltransferase n=1 Tax=Coleophoma cylindrospora TaxID=1849047 RepID=A0A3D8RSW9_9HELO|nr:hypothetical protein BP6252_05192 [Coleophoma cylindrospora]